MSLHDDWPPLPRDLHINRPAGGETFTADQMRKYGLLCALAFAPQGEITAADVEWAIAQIKKRELP